MRFRSLRRRRVYAPTLLLAVISALLSGCGGLAGGRPSAASSSRPTALPSAVRAASSPASDSAASCWLAPASEAALVGALRQLQTQPSTRALASSPSAIPSGTVVPASSLPAFFLYVPAGLPAGRARVMVALHGFGNIGKDFAQPLLPMADANHWVLVAPTFHYHDLRSEVDARQDNLTFTRAVSDLLAELPQRVGRPLDPRVFAIGFSRGASLAENFTLLYPDQVAAAAFLSGGAYTLPQGCIVAGGHVDGLPLPLGTADVATRLERPFNGAAIQQLPLWVSVGSADDRPGTLLSQWDNVLGPNRLGRGKAFAQALTAFGARVDFTVFDNAGHEVTPAMLSGVQRFFRAADSSASREAAA